MTRPNPLSSSPASTGLPADLLAMWTRLYAQPDVGVLPWSNRDPFPHLARIVREGWLPGRGPILDVGCGLGSNTYWLASRGYWVTGVDVAPGAIQAAESRRPARAVTTTFLVDDMLRTALPRASYAGAVDVGCFQTLPSDLRGAYAVNLARLLRPGSPLLLFWVAREETGAWGPPHRLSVQEVALAFEPGFVLDRVLHRPRTVGLTAKLKRTARPLTVLAGYTARLVRRSVPQPPAR